MTDFEQQIEKLAQSAVDLAAMDSRGGPRTRPALDRLRQVMIDFVAARIAHIRASHPGWEGYGTCTLCAETDEWLAQWEARLGETVTFSEMTGRLEPGEE